MSLKPGLVLSALVLILYMGVFSPAAAEDSGFARLPWIDVETRHTVIRYKSMEDLVRFHKSVDYGPGEWNRIGSPDRMKLDRIKSVLILKIDGIFERTQVILDMQKKMDKVFVHIYPDGKTLGAAYEVIYQEKCNIRAWYRYRTNTVYINSRDVHAGMVAHELAHGIIDHFLVVKPPARTAEILARYVDSHL